VHPVENPNPLWHVMPPAAGPASVGTASPLLELLLGREVAAAEEFADQDREPNLNAAGFTPMAYYAETLFLR
jgi:hypothetical protein